MTPARTSPRKYTSADGLMARAGRAHEDPVAMTAPATMARMAGYVVRVLKKNPSLSEQQAIKAAVLEFRADMARLARKSAASRRGLVLDATGLEDCGSDGIDADLGRRGCHAGSCHQIASPTTTSR